MAPAQPTIRFLGAAGTVTGSKHLVTAGNLRVLLDCGLFQGLKELRLRNWQLDFDPAGIDAVVLSHAHVDHSGALPLLVRKGFRGRIYCTAGTADLLEVMLRDAAKLQEEEAAAANRYGYSKHSPALPLFTVRDAEAVMTHLVARPYGEPFGVVGGIEAVFRGAGHILGAATVELRILPRQPSGDPLTVVFSGDLGRHGRPLLRDPEPVHEADVLLLESTYGDRTHAGDPDAELARIVVEAAGRGGALLIPAFAVGRTQELVWRLCRLEETSRIPSLPVFVDSPMAIDVTEIYGRHPEDLDDDARPFLAQRLHCQQYTLVRDAAASKALNARSGPMIVIAGSGMATGGRILHHLKMRLSDPRTTVLFPGFQAEGTRGRALCQGAPSVRIHGEEIAVRAHVEQLDGLSAHADQPELLQWLGAFARPPRHTYLVHGEPPAAEALAAAIRSRLGWTVDVAAAGAVVPLASR
ncbi:MAG TPA: MBL fold metallo-hydrolase [Candidatus Binatia bacterium]|jgi:metallo-beta-lactamase family protein